MGKPIVYVHRLADWYSLYMNEENEKLLSSFAEVVTEKDRSSPLSESELIEHMQGARAILSLNGIGCAEITENVLQNVPTLELICISHWWEQLEPLAKKLGIRFIEGSNANTIAVAEWVIACALMGTRQIAHFNALLKNGSLWCEPRRAVGGMLSGKTVGIVAYGRVGHYTAHYFKMLGCRVSVCDPLLSRECAEKDGVSLASMDEIFSSSEIISLHLPVLPSTRGCIGKRQLERIRPGTIFINSSRAAVYDEAALIDALRTQNFFAYIDVFSTEPLPLNHPFRTMENVVITPHIAGDNPEMFTRCGREAILTLKDYFEGKEPIDRKYYISP